MEQGQLRGAQGGKEGLKQQLLWISYNDKESPLGAQVRMDDIILHSVHAVQDFMYFLETQEWVWR